MNIPLTHRAGGGAYILRYGQRIAELKVTKIDGLLHKAVKFNFTDKRKPNKTTPQILRGGERIPLLPDLTVQLSPNKNHSEEVEIIYNTQNNLTILNFESAYGRRY